MKIICLEPVHILIRWNQHNMSAYEIWGGWLDEGTMYRSSNFSGNNMWRKEEEFVRNATIDKRSTSNI